LTATRFTYLKAKLNLYM